MQSKLFDVAWQAQNDYFNSIAAAFAAKHGVNVSHPAGLPGFFARVTAEKAREIIASLPDPRIDAVTVAKEGQTAIGQSAAYIGAPGWWPYEAPGQIVIVIDTGVQASHPFLSGDVIYGGCFKTPAYGVQCPNANADGDSPYPTAGAGEPHTGYWSGVGNPPSHGTHVAGIAAGQNGSTRGQPAHGVARGAKVTAINVFTYADNQIYLFESDFTTALATVATLTPWNSINTVNISLVFQGMYSATCSGLPLFTWPIDMLRDKNMVVVSAGGNDGLYGFRPPACAGAGVKAMAMNSVTGAMGSWPGRATNYANPANFAGPTFVAPGVDICSSVIGGGMACWNGTSMAAPHIAGVYALLKAALPGYLSYDFTAWLQSVAVNMTHPSLPGVTFKRIRLP